MIRFLKWFYLFAVNISGVRDVNGSVQMAEGRVVKWDFFQRELRPMKQWDLLTAT